MSKSDPNLEKLVTGAQKYAPSRGYLSSRHAAAARALGNYTRWKASLLEDDKGDDDEDDMPIPRRAAKAGKRRVKIVRDESGAITGFEREDD